MKNQIASILLIAALVLGFAPFASAKSGLLAPGTGGTLTPSIFAFTSDGLGVIPSFGATIGSASQFLSGILVTSATSTNATTTNSLSVGSNAFTVTSASKVGVGTSSPSSIFQVSNAPLGNGTAATTTVEFGSATSTARTCFNVSNASGSSISFYFVGTSMVVENSRCK